MSIRKEMSKEIGNLASQKETAIIAVTKTEIHYCLKFKDGSIDDEMSFVIKR